MFVVLIECVLAPVHGHKGYSVVSNFTPSQPSQSSFLNVRWKDKRDRPCEIYTRDSHVDGSDN